jgi:hypothetical protein
MTKEKVIIFEGEHNFVLPKNRVRNKKTGMSYYIPDEMNVTAPTKGDGLGTPIEPPPQPDDIDISPKTTTTQEEERKKETTVPDDVTPLGDGKRRLIDLEPTPIGLGDARKIVSDEEITTTSTTTSTTTVKPIVILPIDLGVSPSSRIGGGGSGGGGAKEGAAKKKTLLQKYWWILAIAAIGGGYYLYKNKKK